MPRYPNKVMELVKELPEGHSGLKKLIKKNYQRINFEKLKVFDLTSEEIQNFYKLVIEEILSPNSEALKLLKNLIAINTEVESNIDIKTIKTAYKLPNIEKAFNELVDTRIIKKKEGKEDTYDFTFPEIQDALDILIDENCHENALKYYEKKIKKFGDNIFDEIEVLYHKAKIRPTEELVKEFLAIANSIEQFDYGHKRLINVAEELLILEDKYKAPILIVLGSIFSVIGDSEDAERIYLNALELYKKLAKQYYRIYLPYIAATQKNLGTLYIDLKRFEEAEKLYSEALSSYKELERHYYDVHSSDFHLEEYNGLEKSYTDDLRAYNEILKKYYDIYLPEEPSIEGDFGNIHIDLDLLEDIKDGTIDSMDSFKTLAKMSYDMYLIDIAKTQSNLGLIYSELQKFEDAERMHLEALKIKKNLAEHYPNQVLPELVLTLLDLGDLYATLNKFEDAEPMFNEALKISKQLAEQNPEVYMYNIAIIQNSLGTIYTRLQKFEEAEQMYLEALKIFKKFANQDRKTYLYNVADVQNNLGNLFLTQRNLEQAEYYLNNAIKKDPTNINILYNIACLESLRNNQVKALELLSKAIEIDKGFIERAILDEKLENIKDLEEFKKLTSE
ncbi:MAG: tetratricopeptide repeat protein [Promethearchaeota archaeon]